MGPFVPEPISDQLNLVVALLLGVGFGFVLEQAGFSSSRRLAGLFYGYDFTVLRVFFTAAVTAMAGVIILGYAGWLDTDAIFVNPTWLGPTIVGGVIMGMGFILGGYCPGTSLCAAAIGKVDAMFFVGGGILGIFGFGELFSYTRDFFESTSLGPVEVYDSLGISQGLFAFLLTAIAVMAFTVTSIIEKRISPVNAPSLAFKRWKHIGAGAGVVLLGAILAFLPDKKTSLIEEVSSPAYQSARGAVYMDADELAFHIIGREPRIQVVDVRLPEEFSKFSLPGSRNIVLRDFFGKEAAQMFSQRHVKKVFVGDSEAQELAATGLLQELGYENTAALRGGITSFTGTILQPAAFVPSGSRWDADVKRFRETARVNLLNMIEESKKTSVKEVKKVKKIQGGC